MATAEAAKKRRLTQEDCDIARFFMRRGMKMKEIGKILKVDASTVGKIQKADFRLETYLQQRREMNLKTKQNREAREAGARRLEEILGPYDPEQGKMILDQLNAQNKQEEEIRERMKAGEPIRFIPGQTKMNLDELAEKKEPDEQTKQMRFQAAMMDKITTVLKEMIVMLDNRLTALDEIRDVMKGGAGNE